jgi:hypothetical protein
VDEIASVQPSESGFSFLNLFIAGSDVAQVHSFWHRLGQEPGLPSRIGVTALSPVRSLEQTNSKLG